MKVNILFKDQIYNLKLNFKLIKVREVKIFKIKMKFQRYVKNTKKHFNRFILFYKILNFSPICLQI